MRRASAAARPALKVVVPASVTVGGAPYWTLLLPGHGWLRPEVVEDVLRELGSRCCRGPGLGLALASAAG